MENKALNRIVQCIKDSFGFQPNQNQDLASLSSLGIKRSKFYTSPIYLGALSHFAISTIFFLQIREEQNFVHLGFTVIMCIMGALNSFLKIIRKNDQNNNLNFLLRILLAPLLSVNLLWELSYSPVELGKTQLFIFSFLFLSYLNAGDFGRICIWIFHIIITFTGWLIIFAFRVKQEDLTENHSGIHLASTIFLLAIMTVFGGYRLKFERQSESSFEIISKMLVQSSSGIILLNSNDEVLFSNQKVLSFIQRRNAATNPSCVMDYLKALEFRNFIKVESQYLSPHWHHPHQYSAQEQRPTWGMSPAEPCRTPLKIHEIFQILQLNSKKVLTYYTSTAIKVRKPTYFYSTNPDYVISDDLNLNNDKIPTVGETKILPEQEERQIEMKISYLDVNQYGESFKYLVFTDVTEAQIISDSIAENTYKLNILNSFSHELNTPLNSSRSLVECAIADPKVPQTVKDKYLIYPQNSLFFLDSLILDILDFLKLEANQLQFKLETFSVRDLVQETQNLLALKAREFDVRMDFSDNTMEELHMHSDRGRIRRVLLNLLQNCIKYTQDGFLKITMETCNDAFDGLICKISIEDKRLKNLRNSNDMNLSSINSPKSFKQEGIISSKDLAITQEKEFGVQISRMLVNAMRPLGVGRLNINHTSEGVKYELDLLCSESQSKRFSHIFHINLEDLLDNNEVLDEAVTIPTSYEGKITSNPRAMGSPRLGRLFTGEEKVPEIMIVDDDAFNIFTLDLMLSKYGVRSLKATNGMIAVETVKGYWAEFKKLNKKEREKTDFLKCIFMDLNMPVMGGLEAAKTLNMMMSQGEIARVPIIAYSANDSKDDIEAALAVGMEGFITKPVSQQKLYEIFENLRNKYGTIIGNATF